MLYYIKDFIKQPRDPYDEHKYVHGSGKTKQTYTRGWNGRTYRKPVYSNLTLKTLTVAQFSKIFKPTQLLQASLNNIAQIKKGLK